jgi:hypothetical protein
MTPLHKRVEALERRTSRRTQVTLFIDNATQADVERTMDELERAGIDASDIVVLHWEYAGPPGAITGAPIHCSATAATASSAG